MRKTLKKSLLLLLCLVTWQISAQERELTGKVTDAEGIPLPGVSVHVKETSIGTVTNFDGEFSLTVPDDEAVMVFSFLGFQQQEVLVGSQSTFNITLQEDLEALDEVVVIGYGTESKRDVTGAISTMSGSEITERAATDLSVALRGAIPGLTITRSGSTPGSGADQLRLRGLTTLQGDNSPLIIVDDMPVESIDDISPNVVESITVLKDAAAAAIYGSRAAAGVILITTKRAEKGDFSISYSGQTIVNTPTEVPSAVGAIRYMEMMNEKTWNDGGNGSNNFPVYSEEYINNYLTNNHDNPDQFPITDWYDLTMKDYALGYRHNLTLSGGSEKVKTIGLFGYEEQKGLYEDLVWQRINGRINTNIKFNEKFKANFDVAFRIGDNQDPGVNPTNHSIYGAPIYAALWQDGRIARGQSGLNIYARLHHGGFESIQNYKLFSTLGVSYEPVSDLKISLNVSPTYQFGRNKSFNKPIPYWRYDDPQMTGSPNYISGHTALDGRLGEIRHFDKKLTTQLLINYAKTFGDHSVSGLLGFEEFYQENERLAVIGREYEVFEYPFLSQAPVDKVFDAGSAISELAYSSQFARINYEYKNKYLLQANIRRDGSSRFAPEYRWGTFPSISAGWKVSNENFFEELNSPISFLKFRASYGKLGNDRLGNYLYLPILQFQNVLRPDGADVRSLRTASQRFLAIEDITWEITSTYNIGMDITLFENRLSLTADYYKKKTEDMLLDLSIPDLSGFDNPTYNVGSMHTKGWELSTNWNGNVGELRYSIGLNIFDSNSIIGDIAGKRLITTTTISEEGSLFRSWFGYKSDGIYQTQEEINNSATRTDNIKPGDIKYVDVSGPDGQPDGVVNELDKTYLGGSTSPSYEYGGNLNLGYKGFDLSLSFQGVGEQKEYLDPFFVKPFKSSWLSPPSLIDDRYWSVSNSELDNMNALYPRLSDNSEGNNYVFSDFWLHDGSYLRLRNVTLGYTIPTSVSERANISNLRIYLAGNNLFSIDNYPEGIDPEYEGGYLFTKAYIIGLDIKF